MERKGAGVLVFGGTQRDDREGSACTKCPINPRGNGWLTARWRAAGCLLDLHS